MTSMWPSIFSRSKQQTLGCDALPRDLVSFSRFYLFSAFDLFVHLIRFSINFNGWEAILIIGMNAALR